MPTSGPFSNLSLPYVEATSRRVRVLFGGSWIVDTKKAKFVWEKPSYPVYFFDIADVPEKILRSSDQSAATAENPQILDVVVENRQAQRAAAKYTSGPLKGLVKITFGAMDAWFEEEEQIFVHPKDPYKRVDVLQSSRHVRVEVNGVEVANTHKPRLLFETSLPVRTYIPKADCRLDLLQPSSTTSQCPYKGVANYYDVKLDENKVVRDIVWWYRTPQLECAEIRGYVAFCDEKVDVWVDGEKQERPMTNWS